MRIKQVKITLKRKKRKEKGDPKFFKRRWGIEQNSRWMLRRMKP